jgi:hypothetical protein
MHSPFRPKALDHTGWASVLAFAPKCCAPDRRYFVGPFNQARNFSMKFDMPRTYASRRGWPSTCSDASVENHEHH